MSGVLHTLRQQLWAQCRRNQNYPYKAHVRALTFHIVLHASSVVPDGFPGMPSTSEQAPTAAPGSRLPGLGRSSTIRDRPAQTRITEIATRQARITTNARRHSAP